MPGFTTPTFTPTTNIWGWQATLPPVGPPSLTVLGNLSPGRRFINGLSVETVAANTSLGVANGSMFLMLPKSTDVRAGWMITGSPTHSDIIELATYPGCYWYVTGWQDIAR